MNLIEKVLAGEMAWHVETCDVLAGLSLLPDRSVHAIVSSPPYWAQRDYQIPPTTWPDGWIGCYGNEPTIEAYVQHTVAILTECWRVLRDDGVLWWNVGDTFGNDSKWGGSTGGLHPTGIHGSVHASRAKRISGQKTLGKVLVPHRVAIAAAEAGWIVRQDCVWHKRSPMPESIQSTRFVACRRKIGRDEAKKAIWQVCPGCTNCFEYEGQRVRLQNGNWRHTTAHEYVFQLVKGPAYFGDFEQVKEPASDNTHPRASTLSKKAATHSGEGDRAAVPRGNAHFYGNVSEMTTHRNPRSVWSISPEPTKELHFAAFPSAIPRRCILASTSSYGVCGACGAPYAPLVEKRRVATREGKRSKHQGYQFKDGSPYTAQRGTVYGNKDPQRHQTETRAIAHLPTCTCEAAPITSAIVLDVFCGTGTTGRVAYSLGRRFIGFEISAAYAAIAAGRIPKPFGRDNGKYLKGQRRLFE